MGIRYYDLAYTYEAAGELATTHLKSTPIADLTKFKQEIGEQIIGGGTVWVMGNGTMIGIPASRLVNITLTLES